jgi:hypothetical protein
VGKEGFFLCILLSCDYVLFISTLTFTIVKSLCADYKICYTYSVFFIKGVSLTVPNSANSSVVLITLETSFYLRVLSHKRL